MRPYGGLDRSLVYLTDTNQAPKLQNRLPGISGLRNNIQQTSDSPKCCRTNRSSFAQSNSTELVFQTLCWTYTIHRNGSNISCGASQLHRQKSLPMLALAPVSSLMLNTIHRNICHFNSNGWYKKKPGQLAGLFFRAGEQERNENIEKMCIGSFSWISMRSPGLSETKLFS